MSDIVIFDGMILALVSEPQSLLAEELQRQAERVVGKAQQNLGIEFPPSGVPPGPPARRTGRLQESIHQLPVELGHDGIFIDIVADAVNPGGWAYGNLLRERDYTFITEADLDSLG